MPELPEVETTRRGIAPYLEGQPIIQVRIHNGSLRWPVPQGLAAELTRSPVQDVERRGKYLLLNTDHGTAIVHLGMSGSLRLSDPEDERRKHDHVELALASGWVLRFNDPRRFGAWLWARDALQHPLIRDRGPEPLDEAFTGDLLYRLSRGRRAAVKAFIMDHRIVVGVGNIYASEALFMAGIHPSRPAGRVGRDRYRRLAASIREVLGAAIEQGGTTLRDFINGHGEPGYFRQSLNVYGRAGEPCRQCGAPLRERRIAQRSTVFCVHCQR